MDRPLWKGTVVPRSSAWRDCLRASRCQTSTKPKPSGRVTTSTGFRPGTPTFQTTPDFMRPDELGFEGGLAVLEQHRDDLCEVLVRLVEGGPLRVGSRETGDMPDEEARIEATLDHKGVVTHD